MTDGFLGWLWTSNFPWSIFIYISEKVISQEIKEKITEEPTQIIEKIEKIEPKHEIKNQENITSSEDPSKITQCAKRTLNETENTFNETFTRWKSIHQGILD